MYGVRYMAYPCSLSFAQLVDLRFNAYQMYQSGYCNCGKFNDLLNIVFNGRSLSTGVGLILGSCDQTIDA